jgi:hypothetical protein
MIEINNHYPDSDAVTINVDKDNSIVISRDENGKVFVSYYNLNRRIKEIVLGEQD